MELSTPRRESRMEAMCNEELHNFYSSQNIITLIKSWSVIWASQEAYMVRREMYT
jgi:hypothetical protein